MTIRGVEEAMLKKKARNTCFFVQKSQNNAFFSQGGEDKNCHDLF